MKLLPNLCRRLDSRAAGFGTSPSLFAALLFLSHPETAAGFTSWVNPTLGDWSIAGNWNNGVPDPTTTTYIFNGATALVTTDPAKAGYLHVGGPTGNSTLQLTNNPSVSVGRLDVSYNLYVGSERGDTGTMIITNGADLFGGEDSFAIVGFSSQTNGTLSVNGAGSLIVMPYILIGSSGIGSATVSNNGVVLSRFTGLGTSPGSSGTATVTGSGSSWVNLDGLYVGGQANFNGGSAYVNITGSGKMSTGSLKIFSGGLVTVNNGSSTVAGLSMAYPEFPLVTGGTLGDMSIGDTAAGRMVIEDGGLSLNHRGYIGQFAGITGSVLVDGAGSRWDCSGSVWSGNSGIGTLEITNGGVVASAGNGYLGFSTNSSGTASISGTGSSWTMVANLYVGGNGAAQGGQGVLQIENGGVVGSALTTVYSSGFLRLGANPTLNGPITFLGGFIQTNASTTFNSSFSLGNGGVLVQTTGKELTLGGNISGSGGLTKYFNGGLGTLKLTGTNTYAGPTAVDAGTLLVNGNITSATTVNNGGTLGGTGTVGTVTVNSGGTVAPGTSLGRLAISGNYNQTAGGALSIEIGGNTPGTGYDQLTVSGHATVGGTLNLKLVNKFRPHVGDTFDIITSTTESGNFSIINGCGFTMSSTASASGIVLTVTSIDPLPLVENNNDSGPGSLRDVIANACPDSPITFAPGVRGAITLTGGVLSISKNLAIHGPGANLLSVQRGAAAANSRIFLVTAASVTATISGLTIANGNVTDSGGGIYNYGTLTLANATLSGNKAVNGGGIYNNFGNLTITCCTLSGNSVSNTIFSGSGGAIFNHGGVLNISNSTISGNSAIGPGGGDSAGGLITNVGTVAIANSTITGNSGDIGGGIRNINGGTVRARSTLIALNTSASGPDVNGPLTSEGFNLIGSGSGAVISPALLSDQIGVTSTDLKLGPLLDNGGPNKTHALLFNSAAIDQGWAGPSFADQRGFDRPVDYPGFNVPGGDGADVGAYEYGGVVVQPELRISIPQGGVISLDAVGAPYTVYLIQFAPGLNGVWGGIGNVFTDASGAGVFDHTQFDTPPPNPGRGFYRLGY